MLRALTRRQDDLDLRAENERIDWFILLSPFLIGFVNILRRHLVFASATCSDGSTDDGVPNAGFPGLGWLEDLVVVQ